MARQNMEKARSRTIMAAVNVTSEPPSATASSTGLDAFKFQYAVLQKAKSPNPA